LNKLKNIDLSGLLGRVTTASAVIREIDGLRFLAIISVVIFHLRTHLMRTTHFQLSVSGWSQTIFDFISNGGFGVNVFFGISGFILAVPFARQHMLNGRKVNLKAYYIRRLTRLEPPYIITLTIFLFASAFVLHNSIQSLWPHYLASLVYSHFFIYGSWSVINPVAWSLETEVQFYLLAPLFFMVFKFGSKWARRIIIIFTILVFTILLFRLHDYYVQYHLFKSILTYLPYFAIGVLFADFYLNYLRYNLSVRSNTWDVIGIAATTTMFWLNPNYNIAFSLIDIFCLFLVFISAFKGKLSNYIYTRKAIYIIGGMCYTIYLVHYAFIAFIMEYTSKIGFSGSLMLNLILQALIILPLLFIISSVFFVLFEKPFMYKEWPNKLLALFYIKSRS
jgi:peptidoglycan/LPS O-acetylase OafA/YrhL